MIRTVEIKVDGGGKISNIVAEVSSNVSKLELHY